MSLSKGNWNIPNMHSSTAIKSHRTPQNTNTEKKLHGNVKAPRNQIINSFLKILC